MFFCISWLGASDGAAKTDQEIQKAIEAVIAQRHPTDTPSWWKGLGPRTPTILIKMYKGTSHIYKRTRLLQALAWFPEDASARAFLRKEAEKSDEKIIRRSAVKTVGIAEKEEGLGFVSEFLQDKDPQMRLAAAQSVQRIYDETGSDRAKRILDRYEGQEKASWIIQRLRGEKTATSVRALPVVGSSNPRAKFSSVKRRSYHSSFPGKWEGLWVKLKENHPRRTRPAEVELIPLPAGKWEVKVRLPAMKTASIKKKGEPNLDLTEEAWSVSRAHVEGRRLSGVIVVPKTESREAEVKQPFRSELKIWESGPILQIDIPRLEASLLVRKPSDTNNSK